jgi:hypothetical protein
MSNNFNQILDNSIDYVLNKNLESSSIITLIKSKTIIKQKEETQEEEKKKEKTTKLDFKALENQMINNQFTNDIINKFTELDNLKEDNKELDNLKKELQIIFSNEYIFEAIETIKHNKYFFNADFNKNLVTGILDLKEISKILSNNLLSVEQKNSLQPNHEKTVTNTLNEEKEEEDSDVELEETITSGFESTMKWVIVAGIVVGLFIIIFLIIKKNNNKMNNLAKLSTNIKYVSTLSDDSITGSIVDLGTEL